METELGIPLAVGGTAEIYPWGHREVLKLFFDWFDRESAEYEAQVATAVRAAGLPVPGVGPILQVNGRHGLVYERVEGRAMWEVLASQPWTALRHARRMAELQVALHTSTLPISIPSQQERLRRKIQRAQGLPEHLQKRALRALDALPEGDRLCHGDFHPGNILLSPDEEIVIDWIDATLGNPLADLARSGVIALGAAATHQIPHHILKVFTRLFHRAYLHRYFELRPGGEEEYRRWLPVVAAGRLSEAIPELEIWLVRQVERGI